MQWHPSMVDALFVVDDRIAGSILGQKNLAKTVAWHKSVTTVGGDEIKD